MSGNVARGPPRSRSRGNKLAALAQIAQNKASTPSSGRHTPRTSSSVLPTIPTEYQAPTTAATPFTSTNKKRARSNELEGFLISDGLATPSTQKPRANTNEPAVWLKRAQKLTRYGDRYSGVNYINIHNSSSIAIAPRPSLYQHRNRINNYVSALPTGLINLGNTCYLNAVLQALFSLPSFPLSIRLSVQACASKLPLDGVVHALNASLDQRDALHAVGRSAFAPERLRRALGRKTDAFSGSLQQDAHEFLCALLDAVQSEVLQAEVSQEAHTLSEKNPSPSNPAGEASPLNTIVSIPVHKTSDPTTRSFGFAIEHRLTCSSCHHTTHVTEQSTHLSLQLPDNKKHKNSNNSSTIPLSIDSMLSTYFIEEKVDKTCDECKSQCVLHTVHRTITRLPRILALHIKRFSVHFIDSDQRNGDGRVFKITKSRDPVKITPTLELRKFCGDDARPALPLFDTKTFGGHELPKIQTRNIPSPRAPGYQGRQQEIEGEKTFERRNSKFKTQTAFSWKQAINPQGAARSDYWDAKINLKQHRNNDDNDDEDDVALAQEQRDVEAAIEASKRDVEPFMTPTGRQERDVEEEDAELQEAIRESLKEEERRKKIENSSQTMPAQQQQQQQRRIIELVEERCAVSTEGGASSFKENRNANASTTTTDGGGGGSGGGENILTKFCTATSYRVSSIVCHHGAEAERGHFTTDAVDASSGEWYRFNDAQVHRINVNAITNEMRANDCYIVFYTLHDSR